MNDIIVLNNNAIAYLQLGNVSEACNIMTQASNLLGSDLGHDTKEGKFYFDQSTRLYKKVFGSCCKEHPSHGLSTMKMAILNNQAGIFFEMGRQEACTTIMRSLSDILASISQSFLCRKWSVFYLNLMLLDASPRPASAA
ncbi:hypothetical protein FRACYDRAFT_235872 [Fragilariopsis cylindrus CCMP1102]|uniref:TPR-like protein n=1 Tax=Fragilariopsis cylindrus CCMP1102 TaxID=635003 RepID=A0A1E7FNQ7_9STRA|nr:hypothetical protein FRACYDRAFT_235872 [Fragilariopsis cylindrus CCMP1102]|eukprot:OEU19809.1 hypothetical protein FRACYDRAFT_235872 [Fragilariopsis cylindrus CCMP1102]